MRRIGLMNCLTAVAVAYTPQNLGIVGNGCDSVPASACEMSRLHAPSLPSNSPFCCEAPFEQESAKGIS
jgi:hypothetical protein